MRPRAVSQIKKSNADNIQAKSKAARHRAQRIHGELGPRLSDLSFFFFFFIFRLHFQKLEISHIRLINRFTMPTIYSLNQRFNMCGTRSRISFMAKVKFYSSLVFLGEQNLSTFMPQNDSDIFIRGLDHFEGYL